MNSRAELLLFGYVAAAGGTNNLAGTIAGVALVTPDMDTIVLFTRTLCSTVPRIV